MLRMCAGFGLPKCSATGDREVVEVLFVDVLLDVICVCLCESLRIEAR